MRYLKILTLLPAIMFISNSTHSQTISGNVDYVSRYIWRGLDINSTPNLQPSLDFSFNGLSLGVWSSYTLSNQTTNTDEIDLYLGYAYETDAGEFSVLLTDYYFPNAGRAFSNFDADTGAHILEIGAGYSGPISVAVYYNFYNDPGKNIYFEIGYGTSLKGVDLSFALGGTSGSKENPVYYGSDEFALINVLISASKSIKISDDFELPLFISFIINPKADIAHVVAGFGLAF